MKILIIANLRGWNNLHFNHFKEAVIKNGHQAELVDYKQMEGGLFSFISKKAKDDYRNRNLEKIIKAQKPDAVLFVIARLKFNFEALKSYYRGLVLLYDMNGPEWECYRDISWLNSIDFLFTASIVAQRKLKERNRDSYYWEGSVDPNYYKKINYDANISQIYQSTVSFASRPTPRRVDLISAIENSDIKLWEKRWARVEECKNQRLRNCTFAKNRISDHDYVQIFNCCQIYVNILREALINPPNMISLVSYAAISCETCLVQEWVEEIDNSFENGKEILTFKNKDEFIELVQRYTRDKDAAKKIGEFGRKRILAEHTHTHRIKEMLKITGLG